MTMAIGVAMAVPGSTSGALRDPGTVPSGTDTLQQAFAAHGSSDAVALILEKINESILDAGTRVSISDGSLSFQALDGRNDDAGMGEIAQALIVALILEMLQDLPSH